MANVYCRVVNTALAGEPSHRAFQVQDTLEIIEFDTITSVRVDGDVRPPSILDDVAYVISNMGHYCNIDYNDNGHNQHTLILT